MFSSNLRKHILCLQLEEKKQQPQYPYINVGRLQLIFITTWQNTNKLSVWFKGSPGMSLSHGNVEAISSSDKEY